MIHFLVGLNIEIVITIDEIELNICPSQETYHWLNLNIDIYIYMNRRFWLNQNINLNIGAIIRPVGDESLTNHHDLSR